MYQAIGRVLSRFLEDRERGRRIVGNIGLYGGLLLWAAFAILLFLYREQFWRA